MNNISVEGTDRTPKVEFDFASNRFLIGGYSYPENVQEFFWPLMNPLHKHLESLDGANVEFEFSFQYFHSSSAQVLFSLFDQLEACASRGNTVKVTWYFEADDDNMEEAGEDLSEDAEHVEFVLRAVSPS